MTDKKVCIKTTGITTACQIWVNLRGKYILGSDFVYITTKYF